MLHYHSQRCKVVILERDLLATPALKVLRDENASANVGENAQEDGESREIAIDGVDAWVTSQ